jgi:hypothetical protein
MQTLEQRIARLGIAVPPPDVMALDWCSAGFWSIDPGKACPVCGAAPDTKCGFHRKDDAP